MLKQTIGENAGHIWRLLNEKEEMQLTELLKISQIEETEFNRSLGWLAREDKVGFYSDDENEFVFLIH
jgi:hypothetical protein